MKRRMLQAALPPSFGKLRTVPLFTKVATRFAMAKKAIAEIRKVEDIFLRGQVTKNDLKIGLTDISYFSTIVANEADAALKVIQAMRTRVSAYRKELLDAVG